MMNINIQQLQSIICRFILKLSCNSIKLNQLFEIASTEYQIKNNTNSILI